MNSSSLKKHFLSRNIIYKALILVLVIGLVPTKSKVVPEWKVRVINKSGEPLYGIAVNQYWKDYSLESSGVIHEDIQISDKNGFVVFPERTIRATLFRRFIASIGEIININPHVSFGPIAAVWVNGSPSLFYSEGNPLPNELVIDQ
jgi:hypothetical protein